MIRLAAYSLTFLLMLVLPLAAQQDNSGGMLSDFLEDTLSADSRYIKVTGLTGALSSQATIEKLTVADNDGIWLTILNAELDWNRLSLLRGRFSVNALTAEQIIISRLPGATDTETELPTAEAQPFSVPEIPVAIELGKIQINRVELAKDVAGISAILDVTGALKLAEGALDTRLSINRLDRDGDAAGVIAKFDNNSRHLTLNLSLVEAADGLLSHTLNIPDHPSMQLGIKGDGPISAFVADIMLASDATPRLTGQVTLEQIGSPDDITPKTATAFTADLAGDLRALVPPDYQAFFGLETALFLSGLLDQDGRLDIDALRIKSDGLALTGDLAIAATGETEHLNLNGAISPPVGQTIVLPFTGPRTEIQGASLSALYDASISNGWRVLLSLDGLTRPDMALRNAEIRARGTVEDRNLHHIRGSVAAALTELSLSDAALHQAVGPNITLDGKFLLKGTDALHLNDFVLKGQDYSATLSGILDGLDSGFHMDGLARIKAADLARFEGLAGKPISGAITAQIKGTGSPLGGEFDIALDALTQDLTTGTTELDALLIGRTTLALDAARDETGLTIRYLGLTGTVLSASATGVAKGQSADLTFRAKLDDLGRVLPEAPGPITVAGAVKRQGDQWDGTVKIDGSQASTAQLVGHYNTNGTASFSYDALMTRIERFLPDFSGNLTSTGQASRTKAGIWRIKGDAKGPAGIKAGISGTLDEQKGLADLTAKGQLQLGIVNRMIVPTSVNGIASFDLALKGKPELDALSGAITTSDVTVAVPQIANAITNLGGSVTLADNRANLSLTSGVRTGGRFSVNGPVALEAPFAGNLSVKLMQIILTDNISYESTADGQLVYSGPLAGNGNLSGEIEFGKTEINIAAAGGAANAAAIPDMIHIGETAAVRNTRANAGLIKTESANSNGPEIALNIGLNANNHIFVRGRGLQAELGGNIHIRGTTANVEPSGQIELVRGNLDIFGRRLNLTKGLVTLQGQLEPYIEFAATTTTSDGSASIEITGPLTSPEIDVTSDPDRPPEEAMAMLIFGNEFSQLSPLKVAQLAASLAQLRGGGGSGKIRKGLGVDTVDLTQDEDGNAQVGAGAYVSDNVYTDISVNTKGETELNINLDVSDNLTIKGTVDSTGTSAVGLFFERDY